MRYVFRFEAMTTPCEITIFATDGQKAREAAAKVLEEAKRLEKKYSYYDPASYLFALNARRESRLDRETQELLQRSRHYCEKTGGAFDVTMGTLKTLFHKNLGAKEAARRREELASFVGCERFGIRKGKLYFDNPHTAIDLGGLVKEYAVDRAARILRKAGVRAALVNFGGDIYALGAKPDGTKFRVGIKDPSAPGRFAAFVELCDQALATSASYERNYRVDGERVSHILHPSRPVDLRRSVSVVAPTCEESGVYATALTIDPSIETPYKTIVL